MAVKTISKNGRRVPASSKGKAEPKPRKSRPNFPPRLNMGDKAPSRRRPRPEKSSVVRRPKEAAPAPGSPAPIWENLKKPWALSTCHRIIAVAVEHNNAVSKRAQLAEQRKYVKGELERDNLTDAEEKKLAQQLWHLTSEMDQVKQKEKAATVDMVRICIESVGGTVFEQADEKPEPDEDPDQGKLYPPGSEHIDKHDGTTKPAKEPQEPGYVKQPLEHLRTVPSAVGMADGGPLVSAEAIAAMTNYGWTLIRHINGDLSKVPGLSKFDARDIETAIDELMKLEPDEIREAHGAT